MVLVAKQRGRELIRIDNPGRPDGGLREDEMECLSSAMTVLARGGLAEIGYFDVHLMAKRDEGLVEVDHEIRIA